MSEWMSRLIAKYTEVNEGKFLIPEEIPANERTAFHGAAAAASKAGKTHFNFNGKKHPVTMKKDTAKAIADDVKEAKCKECDCDDCECEKNEAYDEPQGQAKRLMSPLQKARMDKEKADRDKDGKLKKEENLDEISLDKAKSAYYKRKSQAQGAAAQGSMSYAKSQMAKARKTKAYIDRRESVEEAVELDEISKDKAQSYYSKASRSQDAAMSKMIKSRPGSPDHKSAQKTLHKRVSGLKKAAARLDPMKNENKDEDERPHTHALVDKKGRAHGFAPYKMYDGHHHIVTNRTGMRVATSDDHAHAKKMAKNRGGTVITTKSVKLKKPMDPSHANKMIGKSIKGHYHEAKEVNEISMSKMQAYGKAAGKDIEKNRNTVKTALDQPASPKKAEAGLKSMKTLRKRSRGSDMYVNKMTGRSKVKPTAEAYENIKKATHQGPSSPPGEGLSPSAKDQLAKKMPTPEPIDEPKVDAKNFATFRKGLKAAPKRPGDNNKGDKNVVK